MTKYLMAGFIVGAALGAYGNAFGATQALVVLVFGGMGMLLVGLTLLAARLDRRKLMEAFENE